MNGPLNDTTTRELHLEPEDNQRLANLCGPLEAHLRQMEGDLGVTIHRRGARFSIQGASHQVETAARVLSDLYAEAGDDVTPERVHLALREHHRRRDEDPAPPTSLRLRRMVIKARGPNQRRYLQRIQRHDINFGVGPAGTGKTYLAVACAVEALETHRVNRLILTRPAVEAGERLGFLPGDMAQKVDPYLRPLYDALYEMLGFEQVGRLMERNVIEVAPLAFMRGRSLNEAFVILDEAQNTTVEQMKMFLTRIGFGSKAVITGDVSQVDLPPGRTSGLAQAIEVLQGEDGISFTHFLDTDVVRHPLVQRVVAAYERFEKRNNANERS